MRRSWFALAAGRRAKWVVFVLWFLVIFIAAGPANLPAKFQDAESNEATSYLPSSAESTKALAATEELQDGEIAPAVVVFRREEGLTPADFKEIQADVAQMASKRFEGVVADGETAASGGKPGGEEKEVAAGGAPGCGGPTTAVPGQPSGYAPFVGPICSEDGKAAIVIAYINAEGEGERIVDPVKFWRDAIAEPGAGLTAKVTGGAGFSADAIEVFEGINGTLLLAALALVVFLL
ncbi:MAG: MMPL family transporter, partial [Actinobacteria bacterium]|nr:MMPL family transporter [Actinomycetota bacterium]